MSSKDCGNHGSHHHKLSRSLFAFLLGFIILILFLILLIWLILRPTKPTFLLQDISLQQFNLSLPSNLMFAVIPITITTRNPNDRIGIYYDKIDVYAEYKDQQITAATLLPTGYQGHNDVIIWSPYLNGGAVPVDPYVGVELSQDEAAGYLLLYIKIDGKLRWKVGTWVSGHYHLQVSCPALLTVDGGDSTMFKFRQPTSCSVDV